MVLILGTYVLNKKGLDREKGSGYESGFQMFEEAISGTKYIKFFIVGVLFLIFDLETILLFPFSPGVAGYIAEGDGFLHIFLLFSFFLFSLLFGLFLELFFGIF
jgi:NADH-ubiquinone oxidoreductase chain 3